eukprot:c16035_g1_i2.p1 GENE.c16035_g1_i2~~c16035_g1_i2.p1  ORF type:complete len:114 (+),score=16.29 c16035_g1_i2:357-698(+)
MFNMSGQSMNPMQNSFGGFGSSPARPRKKYGEDSDEEMEDEGSKSYVVERAKSNRSTCRGCYSTIDKGIYRVGVEMFNEDYGNTQTQWYHPQCFGRVHNVNNLSSSQRKQAGL